MKFPGFYRKTGSREHGENVVTIGSVIKLAFEKNGTLQSINFLAKTEK
ncbi:MAG: hypothetical protein ABW130_10810 [Candidatus Thiodiazotropha lotti]